MGVLPLLPTNILYHYYQKCATGNFSFYDFGMSNTFMVKH